MIIEDGRLVKERCSYSKRGILPNSTVRYKYIYDEDGRIVQILNNGKIVENIQYVKM